MKRFFATFILFLFLTSCSPSQQVIQTAIAQTMTAFVPTITPIPIFTLTSTFTPTSIFTPTSTPTLIQIDKFKDISVVVLGKNIQKGDYSEFILFPYRVTNNSEKNIKGIEGIMHIYDMFGKSIMDIQWDITNGVIEAHNSMTVNDSGLEYNQFMDTHQKVYATAFEDLVFKYEFITVMFTDGTIITNK